MATRLAISNVDAVSDEVSTSVPARLHAAGRFIGQLAEYCFGASSLVVLLAVLATMPVVQLLSLGYLLEASGRVARSGQLCDGFVGIRKAARLGRIALGIAILMLPLWLASSLRFSSRLIDPESRATKLWTVAMAAAAIIVLWQIVTGCLRGGKLRQFLWPRPIVSARLLLQKGAYSHARDAVWHFVTGLRLPYYFSLGLRGFAGALAWLILPIGLLAIASRLRPGVATITGLLGGLLLAIVLLYLPFLQARFAAENRWRAMFELGAVRREFKRAPIAYWIALVFTLALAVPLYLLKIEIVPREAAWLPSLVFVVSILPARLLAGWAVARGAHRHHRRWWPVRWASRLAMLPVVALYVIVVYFTQYLSWYGTWSLLEQHAFLVPAPFLGY
jgi:hypothetical protein